MDYIEISGKTVDDALTEALVKLETTSDKVDRKSTRLNSSHASKSRMPSSA